MYSITLGYEAVCKKLIELNVDLNTNATVPSESSTQVTTKHGQIPPVSIPPLIAAVENNNLQLCELLVNAKCDLNVKVFHFLSHNLLIEILLVFIFKILEFWDLFTKLV